MINRVVIVGRLTKQPVLASTGSGIPYVRFTIAVNRTFTNQSGEKEADFISCIAWRTQAQNLANFMTKGSLIGVDGRIQTGSYEGETGQRVYTTDVIADSIQFLEGRNKQESTQPREQTSQSGGSQSYGERTQNNPQFGGQQYSGSQNNSGHHNQNRSVGHIEDPTDDLPF